MDTTRGVACLLVAVICLSCAAAAAARSPAARLHRHLKRLNKPPVKSIEMRPNYHPEGLYDESKTNVVSSSSGERPKVQLWHQNGRCPEACDSVSPDLYGDNNTRLFTYWTSDAYQATGCYNILCSGFVQINSEIAMGASIFPTSSYSGSQYDISLLIWKFGKDYVLGYWPSFLFSYLADSASMIEWGGEVVNSQPDGVHTSTQMGQRALPGGRVSARRATSRTSRWWTAPTTSRPPKGLGTFTEQSNCYDVQNGNNADWGTYFYYGGPGRSSNCQ
ncbi:hypothetical protein HU200_003511 [Digitaria exilis]|uniref:Neprosin PEP catalytic domain-containing protein n=1 Tax=Digitaria exilis TaxID=1010633 RepID=A0A835FUX3_9POAL|nr:hypothetical protein HU200_003511 [Digitaria exilis]